MLAHTIDMPEYDGFQRLRGSSEYPNNPIFFNNYNGYLELCFKSEDLPLTPRQQQEGEIFLVRYDGLRTDFLTGMEFETCLSGLKGERAGSAFFVRAWGFAKPWLACYLKTDRLAFVARLKTVDNIPLAKMITVVIGVNYKEVVVSNEKGLAYGYLLPDNYYNTLVISPNGIVYQELDRKIDSVGTYNIICGRITKANVPTRQPHRKFV